MKAAFLLVLLVSTAHAGETHRAVAGRYLRDSERQVLPQFKAKSIGVTRTPIVNGNGITVWPMIRDGQRPGVGVVVKDTPQGPSVVGLARVNTARPGEGRIAQVNGVLGHYEPNVVHLDSSVSDAGLVLKVPKGTLVLPRQNLAIAAQGTFRRSPTFLLVPDFERGYYETLVTLMDAKRTKLTTGLFALMAR